MLYLEDYVESAYDERRARLASGILTPSSRGEALLTLKQPRVEIDECSHFCLRLEPRLLLHLYSSRIRELLL